MLGKLRDRATTFMKTSKTDSDRRGGGYLAAAALLLHFLKFRGQGLSAAAVVHGRRSAREKFCPDPNFSQKRRGAWDLAAVARRADLDSILYFLGPI